ncbi:MAG: hypothetical protein HKN79_04175 [Flavobacteriales bacterium]|nr:hypothetical protein [Flavobacteriales bacterium]
MKNLALCMLIALSISCGNSKVVTTDVQDRPLDAKKVVTEMGYEQKTDPYTIQSAEVKGTFLHLQVEYSGGCEGHTFELFTDGLIMKSLPPKQRFYLRHYAHDDTCESMIQEDIVFDLDGIVSEGNSLVIILEGYKGDLRMNF